MTDANIADRVVGTAERLEGYDAVEDIEFLDREYTVSHDGTVKEVTLVLTVGGPHIEVDCFSGVVRGSWGGDRHATHVESVAVEQAGDLYARTFEENFSH